MLKTDKNKELKLKEHKEELEKFICDKDLEELEKTFSKFNIFDCLRLTRTEIRHSNLLAWLLDPKETHDFNDYFLKTFLKNIILSSKSEIDKIRNKKLTFEKVENKEETLEEMYQIPTIFDIDTWDLSDTEVFRELENIDLLIVSENNKFVFVIENKIDTCQHDEQLARYREYVDEIYPSSEYKKLFVYLKPENEDVENPYIFINYEIVQKSIKELNESKLGKTNDEIMMTIKHYNEIIEREIMKEDETKDICLKIYQNHKKAIDLINKSLETMPQKLREVLDYVIKEQNWIPQDSTNKFIRCIPYDWDIPQLKFAKKGWVSTNQVLMLEFSNGRDCLSFDIVIADVTPDKKEYKEKLCQTIAKYKNNCTRSFKANFVHIIKLPIFTKNDYPDNIINKKDEELASIIIEKINNSDILDNFDKILKEFSNKCLQFGN